MAKYPSSHFLLTGDAGSRKSSIAAQFPKPCFVFQMDSYAKAMPYRRRGVPGEEGNIVTAEGMEDLGGMIPYETVMSTKDEKQLLFRIEHYQTADVSQGVDYIYAFENFLARLPAIQKEIAHGQWATVIFDSLSSIAYEARKLDEYKMNPAIEEGKKAHGLQSYAAAARAIEELVRSNLSSMRCNVVLIGHLGTEKDAMGNITAYWPAAPGSLPRQLPSVFPESYVIHADENGKNWLQTQSGNGYTATTQIPAPNGVEASYKAIWSQWEKELQKGDE